MDKPVRADYRLITTIVKWLLYAAGFVQPGWAIRVRIGVQARAMFSVFNFSPRILRGPRGGI